MKRNRRDSGVAMIVVLIVGAVVMVFCLSLLLVAYNLYARTNRQVTREQCKVLAQTASEALAAEVKNPESDLIAYFETQIQDGSWIGGEELVMNLDDGGQSGDYHVQVTFTYSLNLPDDDGEDDGDDNDDQDTNPDSTGNGDDADSAGENGDAGDNAGSTDENGNAGVDLSNAGDTGNKKTTGKESGDGTVGNGSYTIDAVIRCTRGNGTGKDVQYYELETVFPSVSMKGGAGSEEE